MGKFTNQTVGRLLLATNILSATILTVVLVKERYPSRVYHKLFKEQEQKQKKWNYANNVTYENYTTVYPLYHEQKNIVMLGNSLTAYASWNELLNRPDVATRGIGSDVTEGFLERLKYILNVKPKIVFIEGGINDLFKNVAQETIIKNLTAIIDTLQAKDIKPVLTTVTLLAEQYQSENLVEQPQKIRRLNEQIVKLAKRKNIDLIDLNQYVSKNGFLMTEYATKDGIHFTEKTYVIWKHEVEKILAKENL